MAGGGRNLSTVLLIKKYEIEFKPLSLVHQARFSDWGLVLSLFQLQLQCALPGKKYTNKD